MTVDFIGIAMGSRTVLGSWVGVRRLFHLSLFLTAYRMVLPQDPSTNKKQNLTKPSSQAVVEVFPFKIAQDLKILKIALDRSALPPRAPGLRRAPQKTADFGN